MRKEDGPAPVSYSALIRDVAQRERVSIRDARRVVDAAVAAILENVAAGRSTVIGRLGTFRPSRGARSGGVAFRPSAGSSGRPHPRTGNADVEAAEQGDETT